MDHYIEIRILPDPEFRPTLLMNALYAKLHRALVQLNSNDIGVSFPDYSNGDQQNPKEKQWFGTRVRLHGKQDRLESLIKLPWLTGMMDHVRISRINPVPAKVSYAIFHRVQAKSNIERIRRRQMRRHNLTYEQVLQRVPSVDCALLNEPFITIKSQSTEQIFRLFIAKKEEPIAKQGEFNAYGLSKEATVPLF